MLERERKIAIRLLITGSGVRVPHNPLTKEKGLRFLALALLIKSRSVLSIRNTALDNEFFIGFNLCHRVVKCYGERDKKFSSINRAIASCSL